jgi:hypothetical protein
LAKIRHLNPQCRLSTIAKLDQRTKEARLMRETRADLTAHVGGTPSVTQRALIEQVVQLYLRLAVMDRRFMETGEVQDNRIYLAWANSLSRLLRQLGWTPAAERSRSITDIIAEHESTR